MPIINFDIHSLSSEHVTRTLEETRERALKTMQDQNGSNFRESTSFQNDLIVFMWDTYVGMCVCEREANGYDDSDFYMTVYENESFKEICFASTRGWCYPSMGSRPDATPEVMAKYQAMIESRRQQAIREAQEREAMAPAKGKTVKVVKGRKVPVGLTGTVIWIGAGRKYTPNYGYSKHQQVADRLGIKDESGNVHWTSASNSFKTASG